MGKEIETTPICPNCNERSLIKHGYYRGKQRWSCCLCKKTTVYPLKRKHREIGGNITRRNVEIIRMRKMMPHPALAKIGKKYNISRQRVFQILKNMKGEHYDFL